MDISDTLLKQMVAEFATARRRIFKQTLVLVVVCVGLGMAGRSKDILWLEVIALMCAGSCISTYLARLTLMRMMHKMRLHQIGMHNFYQSSVQKLCELYGHDASSLLKDMPTMEDGS